VHDRNLTWEAASAIAARAAFPPLLRRGGQRASLSRDIANLSYVIENSCQLIAFHDAE
jgi:hypothetical protein